MASLASISGLNSYPSVVVVPQNEFNELYNKIQNISKREDEKENNISFLNSITLEQLRLQSTEGKTKGASILWCLANYAMYHHENLIPILSIVWKKFAEQLSIDDLRCSAESGDFEGTSVLWNIAFTFNPAGNPGIFLEVWEKFIDEISIDDLRVKCKAGQFINISMFQMICFCTQCASQMFTILSQMLNKGITLDDLRPEKTAMSSALWCFTTKELFTLIYKKFGNALLDHLQAAVDDASILFMRMQGATTGGGLQDREFVEEILAQMPNAYDANECVCTSEKAEWTKKNIYTKLAEAAEWGAKIAALIAARNAFFDELARIQAQEKQIQEKQTQAEQDQREPVQEMPEEQDQIDFSKLQHLAQTAAQAGYHNAYYDLGMLLKKHAPLQSKACKALAKIPKESCYYDQTLIELQQMYFALATEEAGSRKQHYLNKATEVALKLPQVLCISTIQEIAFLYIKGLTKSHAVDRNILPKYIVEVLDKNRTPEWCFEVFDDLIQTMHLKEEHAAFQKRTRHLPAA